MEKLLELALKAGCSAEVYHQRTRSVEMSRREGHVVDTTATIQSGCAIRLIRNGRMGTAYTKNLLDRQALLDCALLSLEHGPEVDFQFPHTSMKPDIGGFDEKVEGSGFPEALSICEKMEEMAGSLSRSCIDTSAGSAVETVRLINTSGTDLLHRSSGVFGSISARYPGPKQAFTRCLQVFRTLRSTVSRSLTYAEFMKSLFPRSGRVTEKCRSCFFPEACTEFSGD